MLPNMRTTMSPSIVLSPALYFYVRAKYEDNHESVNCFVTSPSWNDTTTPAPSCNAGNLDIFFEPRLICDDLQIFPDVPDVSPSVPVL